MAVSLFLPLGAKAANPVTVHCGQTITQNTTLASDLTNCTNNGIIIGADDITLDLNGHTIDGDGAAAAKGCGIGTYCDAGVVNTESHHGHALNRPGHDGVTIENGTIQEFTNNGVYALGVRGNRLRDLALSNNLFHGVTWGQTEESQIHNISATGSFAGAILGEDRDVLIEDSTFSDNEFPGIALFDSSQITIARNILSGNHSGIELNDSDSNRKIHGSNNNRIEENSISGDGFVGLFLDHSDDNTVTGNHIFENANAAIVVGNANTITQNLVTDAVGGDQEGDGFGISFEGGQDSLIADNTVERTREAGIRVAAFEPDTPPTVGMTIRSNLVRDADTDGIRVESTTTDTLLDGNTADQNGDDGIDVSSPTTTVMGNSANDNFDLGIEAVPGVTDGGGNTASGNGNPLQCTNVFCT
jgi:large repetitive protein